MVLFVSTSGASDWSDSFRIPAGITIPWSVAKLNPEVILNLSYTETGVDE